MMQEGEFIAAIINILKEYEKDIASHCRHLQLNQAEAFALLNADGTAKSGCKVAIFAASQVFWNYFSSRYSAPTT